MRALPSFRRCQHCESQSGTAPGRASRPALPAFFAALAFVAALGLAVPATLPAQEKPAARPFVVVSAASLDRLLSDLETIAVAADRRDLYDRLRGFLGNLGDFEGVDRAKPLGAFLNLNLANPSQVEPVGFVPVANEEALLKTIAFGPIRTKPVDGKAGRHELIGPEGTAWLQFRGGHAFIAKTAALLDGPLPDPAAATTDLAREFDLAVRADLTVIPEGLKSLFLGTARARAEAENDKAAQRPEASEEEGQLRRAVSDAALETLTTLVKSGRAAVVGLRVSPEKKTATIETRFVREVTGARPGNALTGEALPGDAAAAANAPAAEESAAAASVFVSYRASEKHRRLLHDLAAFVEKQALAKAAGSNTAADDVALLKQLFQPIKATLAEGRLRFAAEFAGDAPSPLTLVGGLDAKEVDSLAQALPVLFQKLAAHPKIASVETAAFRSGGATFHRAVGSDPSANDERLYGPKPALLAGASTDAVWFAIGGAAASEEVGRFQKRFPRAAPGGAGDPTKVGPDRLHMVVNAGPWIALSAQGGDKPVNTLAREAFARGGDQLRLDLTGAATGPKLTLFAESGYLRLLGLVIAARIDQGK